MPAWGGKSKLNKEELNQLTSYLEKISSEEATGNSILVSSKLIIFRS